MGRCREAGESQKTCLFFYAFGNKSEGFPACVLFPHVKFNNREMKRVFVSLFLLFLACYVLAQEISIPERPVDTDNPAKDYTDRVIDTVFIRDIEIVARKRMEESGLRITRPDSLALHSGLSTDLSELLAAQTPVFVKSYGPGAQATAHFRGTAASHTQIIWNGISLNSPMRGYTDLSQVPLFFIDGVYLLHGGSSLSETSGALGGSIHLENQPDWVHRKQIALKAERGSFQTSRYGIKLQTGSTRVLSATRIYLEKSENNYPFYNTGVIPHKADTLKNGAFRKEAIIQEVYYRPGSDLVMIWRGWMQNNHRDLPPLMSYEGDRREEMQMDRQSRVQMEIKKYSPQWNLSYNIGYNFSRMNYSLFLPVNNYQVDDAASSERKLYNQFRISYLRNKRLSMNATFEAAWQKVNARELVRQKVYEAVRYEAGVLMQLIYKPTPNSGLHFLNRTEYYDGRFIALIPSAGAEWETQNRLPLTFKMNVTRNFHKPGLNDLYWIPGGNPELLPEKGITGEMGITSQTGAKGLNLKQEISGFTSLIENWIIWQPAQNGAWYWEAVNLHRVVSKGLEYNLSGEVLIRKTRFTAGGNYALNRCFRKNNNPEQGYSNGRQLIYMPVHSANFQAGAFRQGWTTLLHLGFTGRRYTQTSREWSSAENSLPPFLVTNLSVQKDLSLKHTKTGVKVKVDNLFNTRYQQILWRAMPGRNYTLTLFTSF